MSRRGAAWALGAIACALLAAPAAAQTPDEARASPYLIDATDRDFAQRAALHSTLAAAAARAGDLPRQARHLALACFWRAPITGDVTLDGSSCVEARRLAGKEGPLDVQLQLEDARGMVAFLRLDYAQAFQIFSGIVARGAALDLGAAEAHPVRHAHLMLGIVMTGTARFGDAAAALETVREASRRAGDVEMLGYGELWGCWNELQEGNGPAARAACDRARAVLASSHDFFLDVNLAFIAGELLNNEGDHEGGLASFRRALALSTRAGGALRTPTIRCTIAGTLIHLRRLDEARAVLEAIDRDVAAGRFERQWLPLVEHQWGKLERVSHRPAEAARHFAASSQSQEYFISIWGLRGLADARRLQGDLAGSRTALEEAIRRVEKTRASVSGASARAAYSEMHASIYRDLVGVRWDMEGPAAASAALEIAEAGRARALLDALSSAQVAGAVAPTLSAAAVQQGSAPTRSSSSTCRRRIACSPSP